MHRRCTEDAQKMHRRCTEDAQKVLSKYGVGIAQSQTKGTNPQMEIASVAYCITSKDNNLRFLPMTVLKITISCCGDAMLWRRTTVETHRSVDAPPWRRTAVRLYIYGA